ncbi:ABC transporter permease [Paenibacillus sp. N3.4]|uniref:fluoroquinolone export ABC transporter permease subunit n=1 Tax=Paenibacillus sp. N3.4 TaxID=2603222 RepID=UPI0011CC05A7|nr:ABC transporter permease [Paenibacillus sp. N3.4]TXK85115.1 ABC transporter permease [Paenibacillus sp. N3.4]
MRFAAAFAFDIKLQFRHGFYYAYALISAAYALLLHLLPEAYRESVDVVLTFSDPSMLGFFFIGGLVLLEKGQDIHDSLFVTPYKPSEYIFSKTLSLTFLSLLTSYAVHVSTFGFNTNPLLFLASVALTSMFFTLIGLGVAVRCKTINGFFFASSVYTIVFVLPVFETVGLWRSPLFTILPAKASLLLLGSAFQPIKVEEIIYSLCLLLAWCGLAYIWTRHSFRTFIILKIGGARGR